MISADVMYYEGLLRLNHSTNTTCQPSANLIESITRMRTLTHYTTITSLHLHPIQVHHLRI